MQWVKNKQGFTIVELLIVVVVIAILAAITIVSYNGIQTRTRDSERTAEVSTMMKAIEMYMAENGSYPSLGSDNTGYSYTALAPFLVPKYISAIPSPPTGGTAADYWYVRGSESGRSYGIRVDYETKPDCHAGQRNNGVGWWSLQACSNT